MGTWRYESFPGLDVLVQTYGFQPFLQDSVVVVVQVVSLVLQEVVQLHDPKWNGGEVIVIVLC